MLVIGTSISTNSAKDINKVKENESFPKESLFFFKGGIFLIVYLFIKWLCGPYFTPGYHMD
jgi:hypothetical protein